MNRKIEISLICGEEDVTLVRESFDKWVATNGIMLMAARTNGVVPTTVEEDEFHQRTCFGSLTQR